MSEIMQCLHICGALSTCAAVQLGWNLIAHLLRFLAMIFIVHWTTFRLTIVADPLDYLVSVSTFVLPDCPAIRTEITDS